jgi:Leucine-rich repeat (LRR) protein
MPEWDMMNKDLDKLIRLTQLVQLSISTAKAKTADKLLVLTNLQNLALYGKANFTKEFVASALTKLTYLHFMASNS